MEDKPIKILQVLGSLNMGGAESRMMDIYRNIDRSEFQFDFVTLTSQKQFFEDEIESLGGHIIRIESPREIGLRNHIKRLRFFIRKGKYDVVHAHTSYHCGMVMLAAWLEHIPVRISHARTTGTKSKSKGKAFSLAFGRILIRLFSTKRLAISKDSGKYVFGNSKFEVLPNAIDIQKYQAVNESELLILKNELGISESDFVIGQIGRFAPMKNHEFTVKWFNGFLNTLPNAKLLLVGDGILRSSIQELSVDLGISEKIIFTGIREDVYRIIHLFNVLFFPSVFEGLGGVALEAQACGIPVVESDTIPIETDMGLGLVQRVSLHNDSAEWDKAVLHSKDLFRPSFQTIKQLFYKNGYTLSATVDRLSELYKGMQ